MPRTLPSSLVMPAMLFREPLGLASTVCLVMVVDVSEDHPAVVFEHCKCFVIGLVIAFAVRDWHRNDIAVGVLRCEWGTGGFYSESTRCATGMKDGRCG